MLSDEHKEGLRQFYRRVQEGLPGFRARYGQREMIACISHALAQAREAVDDPADGRNFVVVEGRTGVGKTIGYLTPGLYMAHALGKKLVISTGSVALQEQLVNRDLPAIAALAPFPVKFALAKGRRRYICPSRLFSLVGDASQDSLIHDPVGAWDRKPEQAEIARLERVAADLDTGRWNGDLDALSEPLSPELARRVTTDKPGCSGRRCPHVRACPYYAARRELNEVTVIVANHDLVLSCLASDSQLLPAPSETLYVFDEAHRLPDVALSRFTSTISLIATARAVERAASVLSRASRLAADPKRFDALGEQVKDFVSRLREIHQAFAHGSLFAERSVHRFRHGVLGDELSFLFNDAAQAAKAASDTLASLSESIEEGIEEGRLTAPQVEPLMRELIPVCGRVADAFCTLDLMIAAGDEGQAPVAKWIEQTDKGGDHVLSVSPLSADALLRRYLFEPAAAVALTSATLRTLDSFDYYLKRSGLSAYRQTATVAVASPFNYPEQGQLRLPRLKADPRDAEAHTQELMQAVPEELANTRHGALVLFTSRRQMQSVFDALPAALSARVLMQGSMPRAELLQRHAERVASEQPSILFGLASFGEGLDLPGKLCEHVMIAKLPFSPPDSPLEEAQAEWVEHCGGNAFAEISLPKAGLTLVQWVGRAIRTEADRARITILDRRLLTKPYGRDLLRSLPDFARV